MVVLWRLGHSVFPLAWTGPLIQFTKDSTVLWKALCKGSLRNRQTVVKLEFHTRRIGIRSKQLHPLKDSSTDTCIAGQPELFSSLQNMCLRSSVVLTCRVRPLDWAARPVNLASPAGLRGWSNQPSFAVPVEPDAARVACPCSTEAR